MDPGTTFKGAGLDRPVLTGLTQTTTRERRNWGRWEPRRLCGLKVRRRPPWGPPTAAVRWGCSSWTGTRSAQPLPWFSPGPMGDPVCQGRHLRWFVRVEVTAPNAPKSSSKSGFHPAGRPDVCSSSSCQQHPVLWLCALGPLRGAQTCPAFFLLHRKKYPGNEVS